MVYALIIVCQCINKNASSGKGWAIIDWKNSFKKKIFQLYASQV